MIKRKVKQRKTDKITDEDIIGRVLDFMSEQTDESRIPFDTLYEKAYNQVRSAKKKKKKLRKILYSLEKTGLVSKSCEYQPLNKGKKGRFLNKLGFQVVERKYYYCLQKTAKSVISLTASAEIKEKQCRELQSWADEINDRQYRIYDWNNDKVNSLLTVGGAITAGILFAFQFLVSNLKFSPATIVFLAGSFGALMLSMVLCLIHSIPKLNSKIGGNEENLRTLIGFSQYIRVQKLRGKKYKATEHYYDNFLQVNTKDRLRMTVFQSVGMAKNSLRSEKIIRWAVIAMIGSIVLMMVGIVLLAILNFRF